MVVNVTRFRSDLIVAAGMGQRPILPFVYPFDSIDVPPPILAISEQPSLTHLKRFESNSYDSSIRFTFSLIRQAHYSMLRQAISIQKLRHFINGTEHQLSNTLADYADNAAAKVVLQAASLFLICCVRRFDGECGMPTLWRKRICESFSYPHDLDRIMNMMECQDGLYSVMWCLVITAATQYSDEIITLINGDKIMKLSKILDVQSIGEVKMICQKFLWDEEVMAPYLETLAPRFAQSSCPDFGT